MVTVGLLVRLEAQAGREDELAQFPQGALPLVNDEPETVAWFAVRLGERTLNGPVAAALLGRADELLSAPPSIEHVDVLAVKL